MGLAFETQLKAHLLRKDRDYAKGYTKKSEKFYTHTLQSLAEKVGIDIKKPEYKILEAHTHHIEWKGRYPIPRWNEKGKKEWALKKGPSSEVISADRIQNLIRDEEREALTAASLAVAIEW